MEIYANLFAAFFGILIIIIALCNYALGFSIWIALVPILDYIQPITGWEFFPPNRIITCLLFLVTIIKYRDVWAKIPFINFFIVFFMYLLSYFLSSIVSEIPLRSMARSLTYAIPIMYAFMTICCVVESKDGPKIILKGFIFGFFLIIVYGIIEYLGQRNYLLDAGLIQADPFGSYLKEIRVGGSGRISSFIGQPVHTALYLTLTIPIIYFYSKVYAQSTSIKTILFLIMLGGIFCLFFTGSRSSYVGFILFLIIYNLLYLKHYQKALGKSLSLLVILSIIIYFLPEDTKEFITESLSVEDPSAKFASNVVGRMDLTIALWDIFKDNFLLGLGPGYIQTMGKNLVEFARVSSMDNQYLSLLAEIGIIGFISFILFIVISYRLIFTFIKDKETLIGEWGKILFSIFTIFLVEMTFLSVLNLTWMNIIMVYFGIGIGLVMVKGD